MYIHVWFCIFVEQLSSGKLRAANIFLRKMEKNKVFLLRARNCVGSSARSRAPSGLELVARDGGLLVVHRRRIDVCSRVAVFLLLLVACEAGARLITVLAVAFRI
jgi:hypothetical protein